MLLSSLLAAQLVLSSTYLTSLYQVTPYKKKNAFWSRDILAFRDGDGEEVDIEAINDGIKAAIELREAAGNNIYEADYETTLSKRKIAAARRSGLAANAMENAFFLDTDFGLNGEIVAGGAAAAALPDEVTLQNMESEKAASAESLLRNAKQFGGNLETAGAALFDDNLFRVGEGSIFEDDDDSSLPSDTAVDHADVANELLMQGLN